jgi:hypothetical protein
MEKLHNENPLKNEPKKAFDSYALDAIKEAPIEYYHYTVMALLEKMKATYFYSEQDKEIITKAITICDLIYEAANTNKI